MLVLILINEVGPWTKRKVKEYVSVHTHTQDIYDKDKLSTKKKKKRKKKKSTRINGKTIRTSESPGK